MMEGWKAGRLWECRTGALHRILPCFQPSRCLRFLGVLASWRLERQSSHFSVSLRLDGSLQSPAARLCSGFVGRLLTVDGSMGEGGGQALRCALALSALTGRAFRMEHIRAGRERPGLAAGHLACVRAAAAVCSARISGDRPGSTELGFAPGRPRAGKYAFAVRSGGSAALAAQTVALPLAAAGGRSAVRVSGGTHAPGSPTAGYLAEVWCRAMGALGLRLAARLERPGFPPRGGGALTLSVAGGHWPPTPLEAVGRGSLRGVSAGLVISRLPEEVARRCRSRAEALLAGGGAFAEWRTERLTAASPGVALELVAAFGVLSAGFAALGGRGRPAERLADEAVGALGRFMRSGAAVDEHLADQLVLPLALASGPSRFTTPKVTGHLLTVAELIRVFLPRAEISVDGQPGEAGTVSVRP